MSTPSLPAARAALVLLSVILFTDASAAQQRFEFGASVTAAELYDDNLFFSPEAPEPDSFWRLSPRLSLGRRSPHLTLRGRYGFDAESYRRHPALDTALAGQDASLELAWTPSPRLAASTTASYAEAQSPGMLNLLSGLEVGRHRGRRLSARQSLTWQAGTRTQAILEGDFMREALEGFPRTDTEAVVVRLERRLGGLDRGHVSYSARRFDFDGDVVLSHVVALGWTREITPLDHFEVEAGPRLSDRAVGAEVTASLRHRFARGEASLAYMHTQTTVLGQAGPVITKGVTATLSRQLFGSLTLAAGPTLTRVQGRGSEFEVYRLNLEMAWRLNRRLSLSASHQFNFQSGVPGLARNAEIVHNAFVLRAVATAGN
ncbi:MAG TPA: hypothetical protein VGN09_26605 [Vicinamibacteria bacterium]